MPRMRVDKLGSVGLNSDVWGTMLPPAAWSEMYNMTTRDGSLVTVTGEQKLFDIGIRPVFHCSFVDDTTQKIIVSNGVRTRAYSMNGTYVDITPDLQHGSATPGDYPWSGGRISAANLNTVLVLNSATNGPFYWAGGTTKLQPLPGWTAAWRCGFMLAYKYYLVALNMVEAAGSFIHKIRWSGSAAEGELPTVWTPALSNDAGDDLLGETDGAIVAGVLGRDVAYIVKEDGIYSLQYVGGTYIMQTTRLRGGSGTAIPGGIAEMLGQVALFTADDLLLFDGQDSKSIADQRVRSTMRDNISQAYRAESKLFVHYPTSTLHVLGVSAGYNRFTTSIMYNWEEDTWSVRRLNYGYGFDQANIYVISGSVPAWDDMDIADPGSLWKPGFTWDAQTEATWNQGVYQPTTPDLICYESNAEDTAWWVSAIAISNTNYDGTAKDCSAERRNIVVEGADGVAMVTRFWVEVENDIPVDFYIGGHTFNNSAPVWEGPYTVDPNIAKQSFACRVTGRYVSWRVKSKGIGSFKLASITLEWQKAGER